MDFWWTFDELLMETHMWDMACDKKQKKNDVDNQENSICDLSFPLALFLFLWWSRHILQRFSTFSLVHPHRFFFPTTIFCTYNNGIVLDFREHLKCNTVLPRLFFSSALCKNSNYRKGPIKRAWRGLASWQGYDLSPALHFRCNSNGPSSKRFIKLIFKGPSLSHILIWGWGNACGTKARPGKLHNFTFPNFALIWCNVISIRLSLIHGAYSGVS